MSPESIRSIRKSLDMSESEFAQFLGVNPRTVYRWEKKDEPGPTGAALAVLRGIQEFAEQYPEHTLATYGFMRKAAKIGGLPYVLMRLLVVANTAGGLA